MATSTKSKTKHQALAKLVIASTNLSERQIILAWAERLLEIKNSPASVIERTKQAIRATSASKAVLPLAKLIFKEVKRLGWDERGLPARAAMSAAVVALTLSGQGAGIAALGGAIGLPLWVVFGAGGAFLGVLVEEIRKARNARTEDGPEKATSKPTRKSRKVGDEIIDVEYVEVQPRRLKKPRKRSSRPKKAP